MQTYDTNLPGHVQWADENGRENAERNCCAAALRPTIVTSLRSQWHVCNTPAASGPTMYGDSLRTIQTVNPLIH